MPATVVLPNFTPVRFTKLLPVIVTAFPPTCGPLFATIDSILGSATGNWLEQAEVEEIPAVTWTPGIRTHYGLVAQDVKVVLDEMGLSTTDFAGYIEGNLETNSDLGLRYEEFMSPMIKAIQELSKKVNQLELIISGSL